MLVGDIPRVPLGAPPEVEQRHLHHVDHGPFPPTSEDLLQGHVVSTHRCRRSATVLTLVGPGPSLAAMTSRASAVRAVSLTVNGQLRRATVEVRTTLVDLLREALRLTGTHIGCEHGVCGACTVLVNGEPVRGCLMLAVQADGAHVETVEGLAPDPEHLNALQAEFVRHHGVQCGFCTAGILMSLTAALRENPHPTEAEIRHTLASHLCRCTGYQGMVDAVLALARSAVTVRSRHREALR